MEAEIRFHILGRRYECILITNTFGIRDTRRSLCAGRSTRLTLFSFEGIPPLAEVTG